MRTAFYSKRELEMAEHKVVSIIREAKQQASQIIEQANIHSAHLVEEAKALAKVEGERLVELAQNDINREMTQAKEALKNQFATLAVAGAEKIIQLKLDPSIHNDLLNELAAEI